MKNREAWERWVAAAADEERARRRRLVVQVVACQNLTYRWVNYEKALDLVGGEVFDMTPEQAPERVDQAIRTCAAAGWSAARLRREA